ncbi:MAG TPA: HAMP domain-containing sensor histidine kinase [Chitinophagaceae bacterium]|nr:HAMP domain-containing sensor histidine kinase [Chitinophagaceae bacterium]
MKKIFPIIISLITLSLIGIIIIQVSWFRSMLENKEEELNRHVHISMDEVGQGLIKETNTAIPDLKSSPLRPSFTWPSDQLLNEFMKASTIASRYTEYEINERIRKSFNNHGLKDTRFEFAVLNSANVVDDIEMKSRGLENALEDTIRNHLFFYPIQAPGGSKFEGLVPEEVLLVVVPNLKHIVVNQLRWMIAGAVLFTLILLAAFYVTLDALLRQKKLSEIKNDFINNMTHEFKTPLATISLAVDALRNEKVIANREKLTYFSDIIKEENKRMNKQVETILQAALTDRQELQLALRPIHVHQVIHNALDNFNLQLQEKNAKAELHLNAVDDTINADEVHFTNLVSNLFDNAVKYSRENLLIKVSTWSTDKMVSIRIDDNGIGMTKETSKRIFEKFYRAHTGNLHNVKGFGLGLSYVKSVIDAHHGKIKVDSVLNRGTTFIIDLPLAKS